MLRTTRSFVTLSSRVNDNEIVGGGGARAESGRSVDN